MKRLAHLPVLVSDSLSLVRHLRSRIFRQPSNIFSTLQYHCKNSLFFSPFCFYFIASVTNPSTQNRFNSGHSTHSLSLANGYLDCHHLWVARIHFDIQWPLEATLLLVSSCVYIPLITWYIPQRTAKTLLLAIRLYWVLVFQASGAFKCYSWHLQISVCLLADLAIFGMLAFLFAHYWHNLSMQTQWMPSCNVLQIIQVLPKITTTDLLSSMLVDIVTSCAGSLLWRSEFMLDNRCWQQFMDCFLVFCPLCTNVIAVCGIFRQLNKLCSFAVWTHIT